MSSFDRHEAFAGKNAALSRAYEMEAKDKQRAKDGDKHQKIAYKTQKCDQCGDVLPTQPYRVGSTDRNEGSTSFGYMVKNLCDKCKPKPRKEKDALTPKKLKAMLKGARKNLR